MPLLKAADYLKDEKDTHDFPLDFLELPEGEPVPVLTIKVNEKVRERARTAENKSGVAEFRGVDGDEPYVTVKNDPVEYVTLILEKAYDDCTDLFDTPSKLAFLRVLKRKPIVAQKLAPMFLKFFQGADVLKKEKDANDKKKSDEQ